MHENLAVFWKTNVFGTRVRWCLGKINRAVISMILTLRAFCYRESQDHASSLTTVARTAPWKFSEWSYRRLTIISRTRSRATQELSDEIYRRFRFVNSSETFQHLCGFWETRWENCIMPSFPASKKNSSKTAKPQTKSAKTENRIQNCQNPIQCRQGRHTEQTTLTLTSSKYLGMAETSLKPS